MVGRHDGDAGDFVKLTTQFCNPHLGSQQRLHRNIAKADDDFRLNRLDLAQQERMTRLYFIRFGITIIRRAALDDVGDVDVGTFKPHRLDHASQQLPGATDKRFPLKILIPTGPFADKHQSRLRIAHAEYDMAAAATKLTALAVANVVSDIF